MVRSGKAMVAIQVRAMDGCRPSFDKLERVPESSQPSLDSHTDSQFGANVVAPAGQETPPGYTWSLSIATESRHLSVVACAGNHALRRQWDKELHAGLRWT